jgi:hypothetical protein
VEAQRWGNVLGGTLELQKNQQKGEWSSMEVRAEYSSMPCSMLEYA